MTERKKRADIKKSLDNYISSVCTLFNELDTGTLTDVVEILYGAMRSGNTIFTMGNGGHGNTASHMINDLAKHTVSSDDKTRVVIDRNRFRTMCLNDSMSFVTGLANDMGFDSIFAEQLKNWCKKGDVVIGISGSGNSKNILNAFEEAKKRGAVTICFTGFDGGRSRDICDICLIVPGEKMVQIEDAHMMISHAIADELKKLVQNRIDLKG